MTSPANGPPILAHFLIASRASGSSGCEDILNLPCGYISRTVGLMTGLLGAVSVRRVAPLASTSWYGSKQPSSRLGEAKPGVVSIGGYVTYVT